MKEVKIDLGNVFRTIYSKRLIILFFTLIISVLAIIYVYFKKNIPIYEGKVLLEVGSIYIGNSESIGVEDRKDLFYILNNNFSIKSTIPRKSSRLIELSFRSENKGRIEKKLSEAIDFIKKRHDEKLKFYKNFIMTRELNEISIGENPINKPKNLSFVLLTAFTSFLMIIFLILILESIKCTLKTLK